MKRTFAFAFAFALAALLAAPAVASTPVAEFPRIAPSYRPNPHPDVVGVADRLREATDAAAGTKPKDPGGSASEEERRKYAEELRSWQARARAAQRDFFDAEGKDAWETFVWELECRSVRERAAAADAEWFERHGRGRGHRGIDAKAAKDAMTGGRGRAGRRLRRRLNAR